MIDWKSVRTLTFDCSGTIIDWERGIHDHVPEKELGFTTVWINRRGDDGGSGATTPATATPDLLLPDLAALADLAVPGTS